MRLIVLGFVVTLAFGQTAGAQTVSLAPDRTQSTTVTVITNAPIYLYPDNARNPLRVAAVGSRLALLKTEGDWYNVEFRDPQFGMRVGYIEKKFVRVNMPDLQPMDLSVRESTNAVPNTVPDREERLRDVETSRAQQQPATRPTANKHHRDGFWFNAGFGEGWLGCDDCFGERVGGFSGGLSVGGTISPRVLLGIGTTGWAKSVLGETLTVGTLDLRLRFYPSVNSGFFITGGVGAGSVSLAGESEIGTGAVLGLGIDLRVGSNVSITPFWNGFAMRSPTVDANVGQIGLGVTIH